MLPERAGSVEYILDYLREAGKNPDFNLDHSLNRIDKQLRYVGEQLERAQANAPALARQGQAPAYRRSRNQYAHDGH